MESELEDYKGEITQLRRKLEEGVDVSSQKMTALERVEFSLRNQLKVHTQEIIKIPLKSVLNM